MAPRTKKTEIQITPVSVDDMVAGKRNFYAVGWKKFCVSVPLYKNGEPVLKHDPFGRTMLNNGLPVLEEKTLVFKTLSEKPDNYLSVFAYDPAMPNAEAILKKLEELVENGSGDIVSETDYQKMLNPVAFELRKRATEAEHTNTTLSSDLARARAEIAALKGQTDE
jgi:hypothetical protein